jgi:ATP-dependent exoDNAse (exonuclease V) beta subunit
MKENGKETKSELGSRDSAFMPLVTVVAASAGAGKTFALTHRYVQILLSNNIPRNALQNVLAITFTNNAASEMKQRILKLLKLASLGDERTLLELQDIISAEGTELRVKATRLIDEIFDNYSDFQVKTIDSFMAAVFTSSSIDYGYHPDFEILLAADAIFDHAFDLFSRELKEKSPQALVVDKLIEIISENRPAESGFLWDPYRNIAGEIKKIHKLIAAQTKPLNTADVSAEISSLKDQIGLQAETLEALIRKSALAINHHFANDLASIKAGDIHALIGRTLKDTPVKKPKRKGEIEAYDKWIARLEGEHAKLNDLVRHYILGYAQAYYQPYVDAYGMLQKTIERVKRQRGQIFIDDVNKTLGEHLDAEAVPEIYFKIGETIYHYLVDEFQDTSRIQWRNMRPLIEESLSKGGSLFVVGDTKQSIYGFRDADWRIMKGLTETNVFPSAHHEVQTLDMNYRSYERIVEFNKNVFRDVIPAEGFKEEAAASGLSDFEQNVKAEHQGKGYVEVDLFRQEEDETPEKAAILNIVEECHSRGYRYDEIGILTPNNKNVIEISGWLNEKSIPFISHSTLDARRRKSVTEFIALLRFLDSPVDDLSFSTFLLGDIFNELCRKREHGLSRTEIARFMFDERIRRGRPLYAAFRENFKDIWDRYFDHLVTVVGYLPLYDLISESYKIFDVFRTSPAEEAALVKLLDAVKTFEREGANTLKNFLEFSDDESNEEVWRIDVPKDIDALQVMTIHKAKGIEFPVVIVLLHDQPLRRTGYLVSEDDNSVWLLKVNKQMAEKVDVLQALLQKEEFGDRVDALNKLYVAFTRAEKEMYVVGVFRKERKEPTRFLPEKGYGSSAKPAVDASGPRRENTAMPYHHTARKALALQSYETIGRQETKRGDFIHRVFSAIEFITDDFDSQLDRVLEDIRDEMRFEHSPDEIRSTVVGFVADAKIRDYFVAREGRVVLREQEMTNKLGALYRADRIVIDRTVATVVDFKTGGDENEVAYIEQVSTYVEMLKQVYPGKNVEGLIAYVDLKKTRSVP